MQKIFTTIIFVFVLYTLYPIPYTLYPNLVSAAEANPLEKLRSDAGISETDIPITKLSGSSQSLENTLLQLLRWVYTVFWIVTVGFVIWAAFTFLTANGEEDKITLARKRVQYAVIAAAIALLATGINIIVYYLLGGV